MSVVLSLSSQVVRGHVGNSAAVFALERLGHTVWALPTVILPHHPGHGGAPPRAATPPEQLLDFFQSLADRGWLHEIDAVLVGYMADPGQVDTVLRILHDVRRARPDVLVVVDPIIGDDGNLYVSEAIAAAFRDRLLPAATIATPNSFELAWLTGGAIETTHHTVEAARSLGLREILATSAPEAQPGHIRALLVETGSAHAAESDRLMHTVHGVGDLMTALYLGHRLLRRPVEVSLEQAMGGVLSVLSETANRDQNELSLSAAQERLIKPTGHVEISRL